MDLLMLLLAIAGPWLLLVREIRAHRKTWRQRDAAMAMLVASDRLLRAESQDDIAEAVAALESARIQFKEACA